MKQRGSKKSEECFFLFSFLPVVLNSTTFLSRLQKLYYSKCTMNISINFMSWKLSRNNGLIYTMFGYILFSQSVLVTSAAAFISGSAIKCFNEGEEVKVSFLYNDPCIQCKCIHSEVVCEKNACRQATCSHNGRTYKPDETWSNGTCYKCRCTSGQVSCRTEVCDENLRCTDDERLIHQPGDCCPSCVENDGECSLLTHRDSDENKMILMSFDRRSFTFPSSAKCNYVLVRDCIDKTFKVHLTHGPVNVSSSNESQIVGDQDTMSIMIKVEQTKIRLTKVDNNWHIRVGRKSCTLPFVKLGTMTVIKTSRSILVRTNMGIKVTWDGKDDLRINIPPKFKQSLCGLCGNYNGNPSDDRQLRKGRQAQTVRQFLNSWKVGKTGICRESTNSLTSTSSTSISALTNNYLFDWKKKVEAMRVCNYLKDLPLRSCHSILPIISFYKQCMNDVSGCKTSNCHCNSLQSYVSQCKNQGIQIPPLRSLDSCPSDDTVKTVTNMKPVHQPRRTSHKRRFRKTSKKLYSRNLRPFDIMID